MNATHKLQIVGNIDNKPLDTTMEFANLDKAAMLTAIREQASTLPRGTLTVTDIHGNMLSLNFSRIKVLDIRVVEIFDVPSKTKK